MVGFFQQKTGIAWIRVPPAGDSGKEGSDDWQQ